ncbi:protein kinase [Thermodesulfobacteriota bacterium]
MQKDDSTTNKLRRVHELIRKFSRELTSTLEVQEVLQKTIERIVHTIQAETITLYKLDEDGRISFSQIYYHKSLYGDSISKRKDFERKRNYLLSLKLQPGTGIIGKVINTKKSLSIEDVSKDPDFYDIAREIDFVVKSLMCVPMIVKDHPIGAITVINKFTNKGFFEEFDLSLLETVASIAAIGINNARLREDLKKSFLSIQIEKDRVLRDIEELQINAGKQEIVGYRRYLIGDKIGSGSYCDVYTAKEISELGEWPVAVKVLKDERFKNPALVERAKEEGRLVMRYLNGHQNIVSTFCADVFYGLPYIVMEWISGIDLNNFKLIHKNHGLKIPVGVVLCIIKDICNALAHAWCVQKEDGAMLKMIHRDIKPQNIMITKDGITKLIDFGIAIEGGVGNHSKGEISGTPNYMSPEQALGGKLDARSDIFSLGMVLYSLLADHRPYQSDSGKHSLEKARRADIPELVISDDFREDEWKLVKMPLLAILRKALAKKPDNRYESAADMSKVLQQDVLNPLQLTDIDVKNYLRTFIEKYNPRDKVVLEEGNNKGSSNKNEDLQLTLRFV